MFDHVEPSDIQLTSLQDNTWRWVIWYNPGDNQPDDRDRFGTAPTLSLAMTAVQHSLSAAFSRAIAYD